MKRTIVVLFCLLAWPLFGDATAASDPSVPTALTPGDAGRKAGVDLASGRWTVTYSADLVAWFFVEAGGTAVALRWEVPPTAPPGYFKWRRRDLPPMDPGVPAVLDAVRALVLPPDAFADYVAARPAPEATPLTGSQVWAVLTRAAKGGWALRLAAPPSGGTFQVVIKAETTPPRPSVPLPKQ